MSAWLPLRFALPFGVFPSLSLAVLEAPRRSRHWTVLVWPLPAARCSGVLPYKLSSASTTAPPAATSISQVPGCILSAAMCSAVHW